jgi:hypothetical protein
MTVQPGTITPGKRGARFRPVLVAAAVCPHPPLVLPGVDPGEGSAGADLRATCLAAVSALVDVDLDMDLLVVVGCSAQTGPFRAGGWGSLAPYGVDLRVGAGEGAPTLPLALTVGRWLVETAASEVPHLFFGVADDEEAARCANLGAGLADRAGRVALLAMGDGSARRSLKGPGHLDARAEPFDAAVASALAAADHEALLDLDAQLADELLVAGRTPWQVLAGAVRASGEAWTGDLTYDAAPFGVSYLVATWSRPSAG